MNKKIFRKTVYLLCTSMFLCCICYSNVFAQNNYETNTIQPDTVNDEQLVDEAICEYDEYLDQNIVEIFDRCKNEKCAIINDAGVIENDSGESYEVPVQLLDEVIYEKNTEKVIANTYIYNIPDLEEFVASSTTGSTNVESIDATSSVKGWCTIYYTITTNADGLEYRKFTSTSGGYTIVDNAFSVISQKVEMIQVGTGPSFSVNEKRGPLYPTVNPWSYNTNFSNPISISFYHELGAKYQITVKRQSSWTFEIRNMI